MLFPSRIGFLALAAFMFMNVAGWQAFGAEAEARDFNTAEIALQDGFYPLAEKRFAEFVAKHSSSPRVAQALLRQSEAALKQQKFEAALSLLATNMVNAAGIADQFQFSIASIYSESGRFDAAATNYAGLIARHTNSPLRLEATVNEARARFALAQWPRVAHLLQRPEGLFHQEAARDPTRELIVRGQLLLAEALLEQRNFSTAEQTAASIPAAALTTKIKWQREFLLAKAQLGAGKLEAASVTTSNAVAIASTTGEPPIEAASVAMLGEILEALDRPDEAMAAYAKNQRTGLPPERVREAVFKTVELSVAQGLLTNALAKLNEFLKSHREEAGSDIALLTLAELRLKQHQLALAGTTVPLNGVSAGSDPLSDVIENCDKLLRGFTNSPFVSKAHLVRGWALLAQGKMGESLVSFRTAANTLPWSEAQAVAWFKTAELEFRSGQLTNALRDYRHVLGEYRSLPRVQAELVPRARYQMLQASVATHDLAAAHEVMEAILSEFPSSGYAPRGLLLFAQAVDEMGDPAEARNVFAKFATLFPDDPLRPEAELAVARSFERQRDWPSAIAKYDEWVTWFPTNSSLPSAEYRRALANFLADRPTNALTLFTNFIKRFPTNDLAARAQDWVGDFYFRAGEFDDAQRNYQFVFENWPATPLRWQARLKAGRAALLRPSFENAALFFTNLINEALKDTSCPTSVVVLAHFAYGDALRQQPSTNMLQSFYDARIIYEQVPRFFPGDPLVPRAWGAMAECYFQLGNADPANYAKALELYTNITKSATADISTRQQARVGIGHVLAVQAGLARVNGSATEATTNLLNAALSAYQSVIYPDENEELADPFWVKEAMMSAATICKTRGDWERAYKLYVRLADKIPPLRAALEKDIEAARKQMELQQQ
ncbi:MAG TPA: tetratricopeptide repeat protein [Verrucomicrobiae bacterium]|jgi:tetratricopeptide (TPR) repeat protein